ncbi:unnamed protein product [Closterium sp. NIES-53]
MTSAPTQDRFIIGQRVALKEPEKGHRYAPRGTVRYVGPVHGYKGEWVGVEWDDSSRGKHDGVVTGKRYFQCEMVPAGTPAGSFVRPQKLTGGITLRDALLDRYSTSGDDYKAEPIYRALGRRRAMVIEFVSAPANKSGADRAGEATNTAVPGNDREASGGGGGSAGGVKGTEGQIRLGEKEGGKAEEEEGQENRDAGSGEGRVREFEGERTQGESMGMDEGVLGGREGQEEGKGETSKRNGLWLSRLQAANVSEVPVGSVGAAGEVAAIASLTELDMSYHLLNTWHEVQRVGEELPGLTALDIGHSRLSFPSPVGSSPPPPPVGFSSFPPPAAPSVSPMAGLRKLGLSSTRVTWPQVEELSRQLPLLETLVLIKNEISELRPSGGADASPAPLNCLQHLTYLDLSDNRIADWAQVSFLSALPSLKWLLLSGNRISNIPGNDGKAAHTSTVHNLHHLSLADNNICEWASIDALTVTCPTLKELVLSHKPYVPRLPSANQRPASTSDPANGNATLGNGTKGGEASNGSLTPGSGGAAATAADGEEGGRVERCEFGFGVTEEGRMGVIARMRSIQKLNCVQILPRERLDAEIWYICHAIRSLPHATSLPQLVSAGHPALPALLAKHGLDLVSERRKLLPGFHTNASAAAASAPDATSAASAAGASSASGAGSAGGSGSNAAAGSNRTPSGSSFLSKPSEPFQLPPLPVHRSCFRCWQCR